MKMKNKLTYIIILMFALVSCTSNHQKHKKNKNVKVTCVHVHNTSDDSWIWYYYMMGPNNSYYYYSSNSQITDFSSASFRQTNSLPQEIESYQNENPNNVETQEVSQQEFGQDMQTVFNENAEYFGGMTEEEMGDYEGGSYSDGGSSSVGSNQEESSNNSGDNSDSGSNSGSDSGGDSGSGDSGGGDGGGGGE